MVEQVKTEGEIDQLFTTLDARKAEWKQLPASRKVVLLKVRPKPFR
jgi:hypothetical protein